MNGINGSKNDIESIESVGGIHTLLHLLSVIADQVKTK